MLHFVSFPVAPIRTVTLSIEPSSEVVSGASLNLRCKAELRKPVPSLEFTAYKDEDKVVCTKISSSSVELLCPLAAVTLDNTGRYTCIVKCDGQLMESNEKKLTVKGVFAIRDTVLPVGD